jgi:hypothetical protein
MFRAALVCTQDPCTYCRTGARRFVLDRHAPFLIASEARDYGRSMASKVYGSEHRVEVEQAEVPRWVLTSSEPVVIAAPPQPPLRWASVPKREWPATGSYRHLVRRGHHTSLCGTTALPATMWRGNTIKPACPECVRKNGEAP